MELGSCRIKYLQLAAFGKIKQMKGSAVIMRHENMQTKNIKMFKIYLKGS